MNKGRITIDFEENMEAYNRLLKTLKAESPPESPFACKAGCNICCTQPVLPVTAIEVFHLEDYLRRTLLGSELDNLIDALDHIEKIKTAALNSQRPPPLYPCPFVKPTIGCSVYEARPFVCRGHNSYSVSDCEKALEAKLELLLVHQYQPQVKAAKAVIQKLQDGMREANLEADILDLHLALRIVLTKPDVKSRWLNGEIVFETARIK